MLLQFRTKLNLTVKENFGHAGPEFVEFILGNKERWEEWRKLFRDKEREYQQNVENNREVASRLAEYAAMLYMAGLIAHEALDLPWEFYDPLKVIWPSLLQEGADPTGELNCLMYCVSWATMHANDFARNHEKRIQPVGGWAGKVDSDDLGNDFGDWKYIAFAPNVLQRIIKESGYEVEPMLRGWLERGWLDINSGDKCSRYMKQVKIQGNNTRMYVIPRKAADSFAEFDKFEEVF